MWSSASRARCPNHAMPRPDRIEGPDPVTPRDIDRINRVFAEAFTDRYQRDGMSGVRVPRLNPAIWKFAIATAGPGAMMWRDGSGDVVAFNMVHQCGAEGWMGPLAVRPSSQGRGIGAEIVESGIRWLQDRLVRVIGLETMPRTVENIGFYSRLGFRPGFLTVSMSRDLTDPPDPAGTLLSGEELPAGIRSCSGLTDDLMPGTDFSAELTLTREQGLGDATLIRDRDGLAGFALWHSAPLADGKPADELRVLKLAARDLPAFRDLIRAVESSAWAMGVRRIGFRCQTAYRAAYGVLLEADYRVHWTDLRMTLDGQSEETAGNGGIVFSNWEI